MNTHYCVAGRRSVKLLPYIFLVILVLSTLADNLYALSDKGKVPVVVTCQWLEENISSADIVILHISTVLRDYENGHIPGAKNMNATDLFDTRTFHFATVEKLKEMFKPLEIPYGARPVFYCNSGNLASVNFVAAVLAGFSPLIYDGSMEEWCSHFDLPVEKEQTAK